MKILLIVDPGITVPPVGYGGIERIVDLLAKEYKKLGHDVTLISSKGSFVDGCKIITIGKAIYPPTRLIKFLALIKIWFYLFSNRSEFDLVHNFGRLLNLIPILRSNVTKIMSYQREIVSGNSNFIFKINPNNLFYTGCSLKQISNKNLMGIWQCVYNTLDFDLIECNSVRLESNPLMFLGRLDKIKGCHTAIQVALKTKNKLIIAGNISPIQEEINYFNTEILPFIDNDLITYVGEVSNEIKYQLLRNSKALLMPIEWEEPFGIVMIEAMACGTPVIAFKRGSVDEIIENEINGFKVNNVQEMIDSIPNIHIIDRMVCRNFANNKFGIQRIANQYISIGASNN